MRTGQIQRTDDRKQRHDDHNIRDCQTDDDKSLNQTSTTELKTRHAVCSRCTNHNDQNTRRNGVNDRVQQVQSRFIRKKCLSVVFKMQSARKQATREDFLCSRQRCKDNPANHAEDKGRPQSDDDIARKTRKFFLQLKRIRFHFFFFCFCHCLLSSLQFVAIVFDMWQTSRRSVSVTVSSS